MDAMPPDDRTEVIEHLRKYALKRMAPEQVRLFLPLIERYYERVAAEDLVARWADRAVFAALVRRLP